jgi:saccharopine dehydrogenase-like NADP-dependent oxidoreductase
MRAVIVVGGGRQGSLIARDLLASGYEVTILDKVRQNENIPFIEADASAGLSFYISNFDLVICALPSTLGEACVREAIDCRVNCVDLSFTECDFRNYETEAKTAGVTVLADCGVAPGLSNLLLGHLVNKHEVLDRAMIYVGGVSRRVDRNQLGLTPSWSASDLCSEYTRPARVVVNGRVVTLPPPLYQPTHDLEIVNTAAGKMEAFYSDGVRSLLDLKERVPTIVEKTLRWPGHLRLVQDSSGVNGFNYNIEALATEYSKLESNTDDVVVLQVYVENSVIRERYDLVCYGDDEHTAMAKVTGHSCAAFAELVLQDLIEPGVLYPEDLAMRFESPLTILVESYLHNCGININRHLTDLR